MTTPTQIAVTEEITKVSATNNTVSIALSDNNTTVSVNNFALPFLPVTSAENVSFSAYNTITANNVRDALQQLADQNFRSASAPSGANVGEGDIWYDTDDDQLKVYRETSSGNFAFVPIMVGNISPDSDTVDAGSY
tara:strand:+ start:7493 stop:7900 length:408 start_codon:yes stop_codon:yes gene_type:complete